MKTIVSVLVACTHLLCPPKPLLSPLGTFGMHRMPITGATNGDPYLRNRVLLFKGNKGQCTGVETVMPSGKTMVLSAAHCANIAEDQMMPVETEQGVKYDIQVVKVDAAKDLLLLEAPDSRHGVPVAKTVKTHDKMFTLTHGHGMPTFKTEGKVLKDEEVFVHMFDIKSPEDIEKCIEHGFLPMMDGACIYMVTSLIVTAKVLPGSSGGPAFNSKGQLMGIVSNLDPSTQFAGLVRLADIQDFIRGY